MVFDNRFIEANGDGSVAASAWDGSTGANATQGPISLSAGVDQYAILKNLGATSLVRSFDQLNAIDSGAVGSLTANITPQSGGFKRDAKFVLKNTGSMASGYGTADSPKTMFTVTGQVLIIGVVGITKVAVTSTGGTGTLALGTTDQTGFLIPATTADATNFGSVGDVWVDATPTDNVDVVARSGAGIVVGNGADLVLTIATNNMTAGDIDLHVWYIPLSSDGLITAA
jgi:hypothetical protein